ncbi:MAG TPA: alpha/beta hydrolase domain-containing protein [Egibacteraceae bacterium]
MISAVPVSRPGRVLLCLALLAALLVVPAAAASADVPDPTVVGPVPATAPPGDPSRDYPFFATVHDLASEGYVEEEFLFSGTANTYAISGTATGTVTSSGHPYTSRMIVRRPADPADFNGTVIVEWLNVSNLYDQDGDWMQSHEHLVREGYAYVGVSAQQAGVHSPLGLRAWNPSRYGALDLTDGGTVGGDGLAYDVFSQAIQALRAPTGTAPLGPLQPEVVIASGHSQSAFRLTDYYNAIQPLAGVVDAFLLRGGGGILRDDLAAPVIKLNTETDVQILTPPSSREPDSDVLRTWEIAGASHGDWKLIIEHGPPRIRDIGSPPDDYPGTPPSGCAAPPFSRVEAYMVQNGAYDALDAWVRDGVAPPHAEPIEASGQPVTIARDELGIARGGIRLPAVEVPTALNTGSNSGPGFCFLHGTHVPFDADTLAALHPSHGRYVHRVAEVANALWRDRFIPRADAVALKQEAARSDVGRSDVGRSAGRAR